MNRRIARGMLSELFGEKTLEADKFMRSIGHNEFAVKQTKFVEENSKYYSIIKAFIDGINYYGNNFNLPIEYFITFSNFKNYTLTDMIATISLFGMAMSQDYAMETW
jgi:penicillin amidase